MARRDVRRHKVRSALIAVMVGLPVLLLTAGTTLFATTQVSAVESIPRLMGSAAARVSVGDMDGAKQLAQAPEGGNVNTLSTPAILPPGRRAGAPWTPDDVGRVFGARAVPVIDSNGVARVGGHRIRASILGVDGRETLTRPMLALESGRWPAAAGEVLATPAGVALGLPASGTFALTLDSATGAKPADITVTVVGRATAQTIHGKVDLVTLPATVSAALPGQSAGFLVDRAAPVTWQDVRRLNTYGLTVASRAVYLRPPPRAEVDPSVYSSGASNNGSTLVVLLLALGIFIETTLLAGPAFAVSAASQRHSLALAASNGAQARQLRRSVLGQALVLGILAAVASVALGIAAARAAIAAWTLHEPSFDAGPFEVPWAQVLAILGCATVAAVVAALLPARGMSRLDIAAVLSGRGGAGRARRGLPVVGALVMAAGAATCIGGVLSDGHETQVAGGAFVLVLGALMVIPIVLSAVGRLGSRLALPLRLATRDSSCQRGRATPAVAAIMAAVAGLTALSIGFASDTEQSDREYLPQAPMGQGLIRVNPAEASAMTSLVQQADPSLSVRPLGQVDLGMRGDVLQIFQAVPAGCSERSSLHIDPALKDTAGAVSCAQLGTSTFSDRGAVAVLPSELAAEALRLTAAQRRVLETGGMLVASRSVLRGGRVHFIRATQRAADDPPSARVTGHQSVTAAVVPLSAWQVGFPQSSFGAVITPATASSLGWGYVVSQLSVVSHSGSISQASQQRVNDLLDAETVLYVERGFQRDNRIMALLFGIAGLLVLVAALISTALSLAESGADMSTLAAVGATRRTRRAFAGGQALVVCLVGCLLGVVVGLVPGIAVARPLTRTVSAELVGAAMHKVVRGPYVNIPWWQLACLVVGVPLLAAAVSAFAVRRAPVMVRRIG